MRKMVAVVLGAVVASALFFALAFVHNLMKPTPPELMDPQTPEAVAHRVAVTPISTWLFVIVELGIGAFVGGIVGARIAKERVLGVTTGIGLALSLWAVYTFYVVYPAVLWAPAGMLIVSFLGPYLGGAIMSRRGASPTPV